MPTTHKFKLEIKFECFRDNEIFASSENSIQMISQFPDSDQEDYRSLIKTLGTTRSYTYTTTGEYTEEDGSAHLSYVEDPAMKLGGEIVHLRFDTDADGRKALLMERVPNPMRLIFSPVITINHLDINDVRMDVSTVTKKLTNTLTERGGRLIVDYELVLFGISSYRSRLEIYAVPVKGDTADTDTMPLFYDAGRA